MMIYGKLIGGVLGLLTGGIVGLLIGLGVGHLFDRGLSGAMVFGSSENLERIRITFFETTFLLLGCLAKSDGRVSKQEVDHTERIFKQMGLSYEQRQEAIALFKRGVAEDFQIEPTVAKFLEACGTVKQLHQTMLLYLVSLAMADHEVDESELRMLHRIASLLGYGTAQVEQLLRMAQAQEQFHSRGGGFAAQPETTLNDAYAALGIGPDATNKELKQAYRKLMSENHPDKLIAKGVPEDMVKLATEKSQEIQAAYEMVKASRGA
ncbi:MAG: co-chaperone DjlA [Pseudomonadota bacterium]